MATLRAELQPVPAISESQLTSLQDRLLRLEAAQLLTGAELETLEDIIGDFLELKLTGGLVASEASLATLQDAAWHLAELEIEYDGVENRGGGTALGWTCVALRFRSFERCATVSLSHSSVAHSAHSRLRCVRLQVQRLAGRRERIRARSRVCSCGRRGRHRSWLDCGLHLIEQRS